MNHNHLNSVNNIDDIDLEDGMSAEEMIKHGNGLTYK